MSADYAASDPVTLEFECSGLAKDRDDALEQARDRWYRFSGERMFPWDSTLSVQRDESAYGGPAYQYQLRVVSGPTSTPPTT